MGVLTVEDSDLYGDAIHTYSRAQAISDGALIDATDAARACGYRWPVAITASVWADCVAWTDADSAKQTHQDEYGRLWDLLNCARWHMLRAKNKTTDRCDVRLRRVRRDGVSKSPTWANVIAHVGPGDDGEPAITLMHPWDD